MKYTSHQQGQTLLETIIAIAIILIGLLGTITLIIGSMKAGNASKQELIGYNLAQEGIEVVRGVRDNNWLAIDNNTTGIEWDTDLVNGGDQTAIAVFQDNNWVLDFSIDDYNQICGGYPCAQLFTQNDIYYQFDGSKDDYIPTQYFRLLYLKPICRDDAGKEALLEAGEELCTSLEGSELGSNVKKVGIEVESKVLYGQSDDSAEYILVDRLYNWKPGVPE